MKILIAAAGTGGHINPGIAIANKIKQERNNANIVFVGTKHGLENDLVPRAGYELKTIEAYGISRRINMQNIKKIIKTMKGYGEAKKLIKKEKPDLVIGTGGYVCGPIFLAAIKRKIPTILHESNAFPGMTVKLLSKKVNTILIGFEEARARLPKAKHVVLTGTPTKFKGKRISETERKKEKASFGFSGNEPILLVFGGSQGAKSINDTMLEIIKKKSNTNYQIMWAAGQKQYDIIAKELEKEKIKIDEIEKVKIFPYIYDMEQAMQISDLVLCRSGAMTITEISIAGKPAIFIPLPTAAENHQEYNAKVLEKQGAAKIVKDQELSEKTLNELIKSMMSDSQKLKQMGENAKKISIPNVEDRIYAEIKKYI